MATFTATASQTFYGTVYLYFTGMQYQVNNYSNFKVDVYVNGSYYTSKNWSSSSTSYSTYSEVSLPQDTYCAFDGYATYNGTTYFVGSDSAKTSTQPKPDPPSTPSYISVSSSSLNHVSVSWGSVSTADGYDLYLDNIYVGYTNHPTTSLTIYKTFQHSTTYNIAVLAYNSGGVSGFRTTTFSISATKPGPWVWNNITSSSSSNLYIMPASKWNDFTQRINEFRVYKLGAGTQYGFSTVYAGNVLTKAIFNQAVNAINPMVGNNIPLLTAKIRIPEDFMLLSNKLNAIT